MTGADRWRPVHVGATGNALAIGNVELWRHEWRPVGAGTVVLPDPNDPRLERSCDVYEAGDAEQPVRFAAGQVADAAWAFHVPADQAIFSPGLSADGSLRYEHRVGRFVPSHYDFIPVSATLIEASSGTVLADTAGWNRGRINGNPDGSLFLRLEQNYDEVLFQIHPGQRTFRNQGEGGADQPLTDLAEAIKRAREETGKAPIYRRISPDGSIRVELASVEWANSHWVNSPRVTDIASGRVVLDLWDSDWDAVVSFRGDRRVGLDFRRYHHGGAPGVELDLAHETFRITHEHGHVGPPIEGSLAQVAQALEASSRRDAAAATSMSGDDQSRRREYPAQSGSQWRAVALILLGALAVLTAVAVLSFCASPSERRQPLAKVPTLVLPARDSLANASAASVNAGGLDRKAFE